MSYLEYNAPLLKYSKINIFKIEAKKLSLKKNYEYMIHT